MDKDLAKTKSHPQMPTAHPQEQPLSPELGINQENPFISDSYIIHRQNIMVGISTYDRTGCIGSKIF